MKIEVGKNKITIIKPQDFDVEQTLNCGQIFRYKIDGNKAFVNSLDKYAEICFDSTKIEINTQDVDYFYHFFDLERDYAKIKKELSKDKFLSPAIAYGNGIRIINNNLFEMLISFMISANNNIPRIKKSIEYLCEHFGKKIGGYYAFPTLKELKKATIDDFCLAGLGYRASQMFETVQKLTTEDLERLLTLPQTEQFKWLVALKGVGEKVANCVMLFGLSVKNVFPVDTWISKVYNDMMHTNETDRKVMTKALTQKYGDLSGYAQQYVFYYYRDNKIK